MRSDGMLIVMFADSGRGASSARSLHVVLVRCPRLEVGPHHRDRYAVLIYHIHSAFVGMAVMAVLLPVPGYVASFIHGLQEKKMAKVCGSTRFIRAPG